MRTVNWSVRIESSRVGECSRVQTDRKRAAWSRKIECNRNCGLQEDKESKQSHDYVLIENWKIIQSCRNSLRCDEQVKMNRVEGRLSLVYIHSICLSMSPRITMLNSADWNDDIAKWRSILKREVFGRIRSHAVRPVHHGSDRS